MGSHPTSLGKDKTSIRASLLSFLSYVGESEVSWGYFIEPEWVCGWQEMQDGVASGSFVSLLDDLEGKEPSKTRCSRVNI